MYAYIYTNIYIYIYVYIYILTHPISTQNPPIHFCLTTLCQVKQKPNPWGSGPGPQALGLGPSPPMRIPNNSHEANLQYYVYCLKALSLMPVHFHWNILLPAGRRPAGRPSCQCLYVLPLCIVQCLCDRPYFVLPIPVTCFNRNSLTSSFI